MKTLPLILSLAFFCFSGKAQINLENREAEVKVISRKLEYNANPITAPEEPEEYFELVGIEADDVLAQMKRYHMQLKTYFTEFGYDSDAFHRDAWKLFVQLAEISAWTEVSNNIKRDCLSRLRFIKRMFQVMEDGSDWMNSTLATGKERSLICAAITINVRILLLHDDYGMPDPETEGFEDKLFFFKSALLSWEKQFENLQKVSRDSESMFQTQFFEALSTVNHLEQFVQKPKRRKKAKAKAKARNEMKKKKTKNQRNGVKTGPPKNDQYKV